jgi:hypothetical protein
LTVRVKDRWEGREVKEDALLELESVRALIEALHGRITRVFKHFRVGGMEVDAILHCARRAVRTVGLELKELDLERAARQALERRPYFNYFYVVARTNVREIGYPLRRLHRLGLLGRLFEGGVGLIAVDGSSSAYLLLSSKFRPSPLGGGAPAEDEARGEALG